MKPEQVRQFAAAFLEATDCQILESSAQQMTVKLSPRADKELTNRPYYWNFVERTGVEPETMTFTFRFTPQVVTPAPATQTPPSTTDSDSILQRYLGVSPAPIRAVGEPLLFGGGRLEQMFAAAAKEGRFVQMFEQPQPNRLSSTRAPLRPYETWLCLNIKVELTCDLKRDELHSLAISLNSGKIVEQFHDQMLQYTLSPKLPHEVYTRSDITVERALMQLEAHLENKLVGYDHDWASAAQQRYLDEFERIDQYYRDVFESLPESEEAALEEVDEQRERRLQEIEWQFRPRIQATVINGGLFHLLSDGSSDLRQRK